MTTEPHYEPVNLDLEKALTKIARALFDYTKSQNDYVELGRLDPFFTVFEKVANDYHQRTGSLHPDLGTELKEWHDSVRELYAADHLPLSAHNKELVDVYGRIPQDIIRYLENKLGLTG